VSQWQKQWLKAHSAMQAQMWALPLRALRGQLADRQTNRLVLFVLAGPYLMAQVSLSHTLKPNYLEEIGKQYASKQLNTS
jgi:hypothetical protein